MFDLSLLARLWYLPSGKLDLVRFSAGSTVLLLASSFSGVIAGLLCSYSEIEIVPGLSHLSVIVPAAFGVVLAWLVAKFVRFSHCRNPLAAALVGAVCGVVIFLSECHMSGMIATLRDDNQSTLVASATRTDQIRRGIYGRIFASSVQQPQRDEYSRFNIPQSILLLIEIGILIWIPARAGRNFARRAYGEAIDCWLDRSIVRARPGSGDRIITVLEAGEFLVQTLSSLPLCSTDPRPGSSTDSRRVSHHTKGDIAATWMVLEVSPFPAANGAYEGYLSATEIDNNGKKRPLFHQLKLRSHEIAVARKLFLETSTDWQAREAKIENDQLDFDIAGPQVAETSNKSVLHGI